MTTSLKVYNPAAKDHIKKKKIIKNKIREKGLEAAEE